MIGAQIIAHLFGDYVLQSHWMASEKTKHHLPALLHALSYGLPFLFLHPSLAAWLVIVGTHFIIDRWRIARYVVWAKNQVGTAAYRPPLASATGYPDDTPPWLAFWLLIAADNALHLAINAAALRWL